MTQSAGAGFRGRASQPAAAQRDSSGGVSHARRSRRRGRASGVVFALTGANWPIGAGDGTGAMAQGTMMALIFVCSVLAAVGLAVTGNSRRSPVNTLGPLGVLAAAFLAVSIGYLEAPESLRMEPWFAVASTLGGAAIAGWVFLRQTGAVTARFAGAAVIAVAIVVLQAAYVAPLLAFAGPVVAIVITVWGGGGRDDRTRYATGAGGPNSWVVQGATVGNRDVSSR
ncbi:MAG: hypothetical protein ACTH31_16805 [Pseudoclavibacter sp.]